MATYLIKRLLLMIPTLFGILIVSFFVIRMAPGDPASEKFGGAGQAAAGVNADRGTEAAEKRFRARHGFDSRDTDRSRATQIESRATRFRSSARMRRVSTAG